MLCQAVCGDAFWHLPVGFWLQERVWMNQVVVLASLTLAHLHRQWCHELKLLDPLHVLPVAVSWVPPFAGEA